MFKNSYFFVILILLLGFYSVLVYALSPKEYIEPKVNKLYSHTLCKDGWISSSQGRGTCSHHSGIREYVYREYKYCEDSIYTVLKNDKCYKQDIVLANKEQSLVSVSTSINSNIQTTSTQSSYFSSSYSYSKNGEQEVPYSTLIAGALQGGYTIPGDSVYYSRPESNYFFSTSSSSFNYFSKSSSSYSSSKSSSSSQKSSSSSSFGLKNKSETFLGQIGNQPVEVNINTIQIFKDGVIHKSGTINYTKAANTPIPLDYMEIENIECENGLSLCSTVIIKEKVENGGQIVQTTKINKKTQEKMVGKWQWQSQDGDVVYDVSWEGEKTPNQ